MQLILIVISVTISLLLLSAGHRCTQCGQCKTRPGRSVRLQRSKRDLSLAALRSLDNRQFVRPDDVKDNLGPHSSTDISIRTKRCNLQVCSVHDLAHRLHYINNKLKIRNKPTDKIN